MNLEKLGEKLAKAQIKKGGLFILLLVLLLVLSLPGIPLLMNNIEPSLEKILPQEVKEVTLMNDMRGQFGADMTYLLLEVTGLTLDVRDPAVITYINILSTRLEENDYILEVRGLDDVVLSLNNGIIPNSNKEIRSFLSLHPETPMYVNHDYSLAVIHLRTDTGASAALIDTMVKDVKHVIEISEEFNPGLDVQMTGFNTIDKATFNVIMNDFKNITLLSFALMLTFLFFYFGSFKKVMASVSVIMFSLIITLGLTGYLGLTITVITMVAAAMIMALGISYGINVTFDYYRLREKEKKNIALVSLNRNLIRALVGSSLTTSAGFLALLFGIIPAMKTLGIVLAMGISITLVVSILFLPVILFMMDKNRKGEK